MAGDWIKIEAVTPGKPEVDMIAELLGVTVNEVIGGLVRLWIWADQQTIDGNARSVTKSAIERNSGVTGLADAMLHPAVCWLEADESGGFRFPNFERHNGQTTKQRALTAKRVAAHKQRKGNAPSVTSALPREEKRREESIDTTNVVSCPEPTGSGPAIADSQYGFPVRGGGTWYLKQRKLEEYRDAYTSISVASELTKARQWLRDNPAKRKSPGGMPRFLTGWLNRAGDNSTGATSRKSFDDVIKEASNGAD